MSRDTNRRPGLGRSTKSENPILASSSRGVSSNDSPAHKVDRHRRRTGRLCLYAAQSDRGPPASPRSRYTRWRNRRPHLLPPIKSEPHRQSKAASLKSTLKRHRRRFMKPIDCLTLMGIVQPDAGDHP